MVNATRRDFLFCVGIISKNMGDAMVANAEVIPSGEGGLKK